MRWGKETDGVLPRQYSLGIGTPSNWESVGKGMEHACRVTHRGSKGAGVFVHQCLPVIG